MDNTRVDPRKSCRAASPYAYFRARHSSDLEPSEQDQVDTAWQWAGIHESFLRLYIHHHSHLRDHIGRETEAEM